MTKQSKGRDANCSQCYDGSIYKSKYRGYRCYACDKEAEIKDERDL